MANGRVPSGSAKIGRVTAALARGAGTAAARFPVATLLIVVISLLSNLAVRERFIPNEADFPWLLASLYGAAASAVVATLAAEARKIAAPMRHGGALAVAAIVGLAVWFGPRLGVYPPAMIAAVTLAVPLAPFLGRGDGMRFWTFTLWTVVGVVLAFLSVLLFTLGLSAILEMIRFLFAVGLSGDAYEHIFVTAFTLVGPLFALGRVPTGFDEAFPGTQDRLVAGVRIMVGWIAAPLALVTALVLHLYAVKILATASLPANEIGWIVTFFALLVLTLRIAISPFLSEATPPIRLFGRGYVAMLVVPLALLAIAATIRIAAEGATLPRYYLALGILAGGLVVAIQSVKRLRGDIRLMAAVPLSLLVLSSVGPWGAAATVGRSQTTLIVAEADGNEGNAVALIETERDQAAQRRLRSRLYALENAGQIERVLPYLDPGLRERVAAATTRETDVAAFDVLMVGLGLSRPSALRTVRSFTAAASAIIETDGFDLATTELSVAAGDIGESPRDLETSSIPAVGIDGDQLVMRVGAVEDRFDLAGEVARLPESVFATEPDRLVPPVLNLEGAGGRRLRLVLRQLIQEGPDGAITAATIILYYRANDWDPA